MFLAFFANVHAQENKMKKMPVFIGCEQFSTNDDLKICFNKSVGQEIQKEIEFFSNIADYMHIGNTVSKLKFSVLEEGKLTKAEAQGVNPIFNSFVWSSIFILQNRIDEAGLSIKPALDEKGNPIEITLSIPVRFETQNNEQHYNDFPVDERVLFTIDFEDEIIEIRINKDFVLKTYGNNGVRDFYLGKYNNLFELSTVEPYASKVDEFFKSSYTPITKGNLDGKEYKIRMKNFFSNNPKDEVLIEVIREDGETWAEYYAYKSKEEFNQSKFAKLTYR